MVKNCLPYRILFVCLALLTNTFGQHTALTKQHHHSFFPKELEGKTWKPLIALDARRSFFRGKPVKINGFRLGVQCLGVHRMGIGYYTLDRNVVFKDIQVNQPGATDSSRVVFNAGFGTLFYERVMYKTKRWEFALPSEVLFGKITGYYEHNSGKFLPLPNVPFVGIAIGLQAKYNILPWLAPRVSVGHRFLYSTTSEIHQSFNKPYYSFGVQIMIGELYQAVKRTVWE